MTTTVKFLLFIIILVVPGLLSLVTAQVSFHRASSLEFCGSCHVMTPWFENVTDPESDSLAAEHYKRRWIQHDQCFTCHSDYSFLGPIEAKINGMHHVIAFYFGTPRHIELYKPFPNSHCLKCHLDAKGFREDPNHDPFEDLLSGKDKCVDCHENVHGVEQEIPEEAEAAPDADEAEAEDDGDASGEDGAGSDDAGAHGEEEGDGSGAE